MILAFDILLCLLLVALAWQAATGRDGFTAVLFFIVFGLAMSLAWVRLGAPNVALAEAAIGAGLTGLLLIAAHSRLTRPVAGEAPPDASPLPAPRWPAKAACGLVAILAGGGLAWAALAPGMGQHGLAGPALAAQAAYGMANTVTGVLLMFRGYDTLLETAVMLAALLSLWSVTPDRYWGGVPGRRQLARPGGILSRFGRLLPPLAVVIAFHLWWTGTDAPGGAFQAATVLAAVAILAFLAGLGEPPPVRSLRLRGLLLLGPLSFVLLGLLGAATGAGFLGVDPDAAKPLLLGLEAALALSIATTLALLTIGVPERLPAAEGAAP